MAPRPVKGDLATGETGSSLPNRKPRTRRPRTPKPNEPKGRLPPWLRGWGGLIVFGAAGLVLLYLAYAIFVSVSDGTLVEVEMHLGTNPDGSLYLRCGPATTEGACTFGSDQATFTVEARDRVHATLFVDDAGGNQTHRIHLEGGPYSLWPAGFSQTLVDCVPARPCASFSFTAWAQGSYRIVCQIDGHAEAGMRATLRVD